MLTGGWYEANLGFGRCLWSYIPLELDKLGQRAKQKEMMDEWLLGRLSPQAGDEEAIGALAVLPTLGHQLGIKRVIFCIGDLRLQEVLPVMQACG